MKARVFGDVVEGDSIGFQKEVLLGKSKRGKGIEKKLIFRERKIIFK